MKLGRLSCHRFRANEVRLWLSVIAYNLGNLWVQPVNPYTQSVRVRPAESPNLPR